MATKEELNKRINQLLKESEEMMDDFDEVVDEMNAYKNAFNHLKHMNLAMLVYIRQALREINEIDSENDDYQMIDYYLREVAVQTDTIIHTIERTHLRYID
jgi:predicted nuclease with TOPRIM domain